MEPGVASFCGVLQGCMDASLVQDARVKDKTPESLLTLRTSNVRDALQSLLKGSWDLVTSVRIRVTVPITTCTWRFIGSNKVGL